VGLKASGGTLSCVSQFSSRTVASAAGQFVGGGSAGVGGPAREVGEEVEFGLAVSGVPCTAYQARSGGRLAHAKPGHLR
jgi:hypothetical protein